MRAPVIYVFFNRPEVTRKTFAAIRAARPHRLYLIADGPRSGHPTDAVRCQETRTIVEGMLDWPCEVTRDYSATNLGCGRRVSQGLTAGFAHLGEAIVLEDDVLPHPDFFPFCAAMLERHRADANIHSIAGFQPLGRYAPNDGAVVPSTFSWIWGWASWNRAWEDYRFDFSESWAKPAVREEIRAYVDDPFNFHWHAGNFDGLVADAVDTWDFQWTYTLLSRRRVSLVSTVNLITNLGFNAEATHTTKQDLYLLDLKTRARIPTARERATATPDRLHDKLYGQIIHAGSRRKIALLRLLARFPVLARQFMKT
jgi:hypothetical protein